MWRNICGRHMAALQNYEATWTSLLTNEKAKSTTTRRLLRPNRLLTWALADCIGRFDCSYTTSNCIIHHAVLEHYVLEIFTSWPNTLEIGKSFLFEGKVGFPKYNVCSVCCGSIHESCRKLINKICSFHDVAEILLNLVLNTTQSINQPILHMPLKITDSCLYIIHQWGP